ncbi:ATP-dependent DNA ligase [Brevibacterium yomogidense]
MAGSGSRTQRTVTVDGRKLRLTHLDKILYPESGTTKADVQEYLAAVAPVLLPQSAWRPVTRKRWPDGVGSSDEPQKPFFRKDLEKSAPDWVPRMQQEHSDHTNTYPLANDPAVLAWFGQVAALEIHVPQWRFAPDGTAQNPDRLVLDLDPGPGTGLSDCAELARLCRQILTDMGLEAVPVTSGSKGLHLYAALDGSYTSEQVSRVAHELARSLEADHPDLAVSDMKKELRRGKILVDWSQNSASKTTVCPYSLRGRSWPTVAAPRTWDELDDSGLRQLDLHEVMARVAEGTDPMESFGIAPEAGATEAAADALRTYRSKRDRRKTPEPVPSDSPRTSGTDPIFVIQEHHASRLHYDTRLEREDVLVSWAVPKGPPLRTGINRLAVQTEDHPMEYATFEGRIPKGEYGAGEVSIWDTGTIEIEKWKDGEEVIAVLHGRPDGGLGGEPRRFVFIHTDGDQWLMQLMKEQPKKSHATSGTRKKGKRAGPTERKTSPREEAPPAPMLATPASPGDIDPDEDWAFEGKWDGYRAIISVGEDGVDVRSRNGNDMSDTFPELAELAQLAPPGTVVDGEIVALDRRSRPNFGLLQTRGKLTSRRGIDRARNSTPVQCFVFDVLRTPERGDVHDLDYDARRALLERTLKAGAHVQVPAVLGSSEEIGLDDALDISRELGLEGVLAKRRDSTYRPGRRTHSWLKLKHDAHQEVVLIGWRHGRGERSDTFGSLLLAVPDEGKDSDSELHYAGRVGTGFAAEELTDLRARLQGMARKTPAAHDVPAADRRDAQWVSPKLVGEVSHSGRTRDGRLRHPVWRGLRPDKEPGEVRWEGPQT